MNSRLKAYSTTCSHAPVSGEIFLGSEGFIHVVCTPEARPEKRTSKEPVRRSVETIISYHWVSLGSLKNWHKTLRNGPAAFAEQCVGGLLNDSGTLGAERNAELRVDGEAHGPSVVLRRGRARRRARQRAGWRDVLDWAASDDAPTHVHTPSSKTTPSGRALWRESM